MQRKGIVLAGGQGTRLRPLTNGVCKPLLPIYDKPMIYYPISTLMLAGIRDIAIITTPQDRVLFERYLGDGSQWGIRFTYIDQPSPDGIAQAYTLAEDFLSGAPSTLILGDNLFFGAGLAERLIEAAAQTEGGRVFAYEVNDPERYGVVAFDGNRVKSIVEKPSKPESNYAATGIYFLDGDAPRRARSIQPSARGELEITSLLDRYLCKGELSVELLDRSFTWFDAGTHESLLEASVEVQRFQCNGKVLGSPEEIAFRRGWNSYDDMRVSISHLAKTKYGSVLRDITQNCLIQNAVA